MFNNSTKIISLEVRNLASLLMKHPKRSIKMTSLFSTASDRIIEIIQAFYINGSIFWRLKTRLHSSWKKCKIVLMFFWLFVTAPELFRNIFLTIYESKLQSNFNTCVLIHNSVQYNLWFRWSVLGPYRVSGCNRFQTFRFTYMEIYRNQPCPC